ncbi:hypothetical protein [Quadrisphaera setariae]|uniref:Uncharacterized protein n=1 Tax=Quadrisphaera setariae TaxID=2593304 RepID=A0A5C8Z1X1_9ACTN|nr:hypothetical protein [Quadrisphaera setariae]TXR51547.1 hypothetical protein FMM08_22335 [Quadrisphaera setariae]
MSTEPASTAQLHDPGERSPAALLAQLQRQIAEATVAVAIAEGRDPVEAMKTSAVEELLAERAAEAAAEEEADAASFPVMIQEKFLAYLVQLHRRAIERENVEAERDNPTT